MQRVNQGRNENLVLEYDASCSIRADLSSVTNASSGPLLDWVCEKVDSVRSHRCGFSSSLYGEKAKRLISIFVFQG